MPTVHYMAIDPSGPDDETLVYPRELPRDHQSWGDLFLEADGNGVHEIEAMLGDEKTTIPLRETTPSRYEAVVEEIGVFSFTARPDRICKYAGAYPPSSGRRMVPLGADDNDLLEIAAIGYGLVFHGHSKGPGRTD